MKIIRLAIELKESTAGDMNEIALEVSALIASMGVRANMRADASGGTQFDFDVVDGEEVSTSAVYREKVSA